MVTEDTGVASAASALLGCDVHVCERVRGGGNNAIFRIESERGRFALKRYLTTRGDAIDRLGREFEALTVLADAGESAVPRPVAMDRSAGIAAYEWVTGERVARLQTDDVDAALAFVARLLDYSRTPAAAGLRDAAEACVTDAALRAQIRSRLDVLAAGAEPRLAHFLADRFVPAWALLDVAPAPDDPLPRERQTLSPSDFGSHNMLRRPGGALVFLDFEYFGWDDPVKLIADTLWHPGSALGPEERSAFGAGAQRIFHGDPDYSARFARRAPLFALRWALIVLSEFIPESWERRRQAGQTAAWETVKAAQLVKAVAFVNRALEAFDQVQKMKPLSPR